jgi:hypothetical protein
LNFNKNAPDKGWSGVLVAAFGFNWHIVCFNFWQQRGATHESAQPHERGGSAEIKEAEEGFEKAHGCKHYRAVPGITTASGALVRGGSFAKFAMKKFRQGLASPLYLGAIGIAMVGWLWAIFAGVGWLLGA